MYEVELKVRADHDGVRDRLAALDGASHGTVEQEDVYYDAPHRTFADTDEALRVRRERDDAGETTRFTYKGPLLEAASKTRIEHETTVDDREALAGILDGLGFTPAATVEKRRERFACRDYTVSLDTVTDLGEFVEVEREVGAEDDIESAREGARRVLTDLGCDPDTQIRTSYLGQLLGSATGSGDDSE